MNFTIGWLTLGPESEDDPNPGPQNADWHLANIVEIKEIPGRGKKFKTIRTSDGVLEECTLTVRSITDTRYQQLKKLCRDGGPYIVKCNHGILPMYVIDRNINHAANDKEPPQRTDDDSDYLNVATWTIKLLEAND